MSIQNSSEISNVKVMLKTGMDGSGIATIEKTSTSGLVDTYTITLDDGRKTTFDVTNGSSIDTIEKTDTSGYVDTYTITLTNGQTSTFTVTNGANGGMSAKFVITSDAGSTVTVTTPSGTVITATQVGGTSDTWQCESAEYGVHTISSTLNGTTVTDTVDVTTCTIYTKVVYHFMALVNITSGAYLANATVTVKNSSNVTVGTVTLNSSGAGSFYITDAGTYTFNATVQTQSLVETLVVSAETTYSVAFQMATIAVTCDDASFIGQTVTCSNGSTTISQTVPNSRIVNFYVKLGTWTLYNPVKAKNEDPITVNAYTTYSFTMKKLKIVTWANGTDAEIVAMVEAADNGDINLADYWSVGDERIVNLSAMSATGVSESHVAQSVTFVLMHAGLYDLTSAVASGRTKCSFIVGMKNCLSEEGYVKASTSGGEATYIGSWKESNRRTWCNNVFRNAIPSSIRGIFKQFKTLTASVYNGTTNEYTNDYFALPAEKEVIGSYNRGNQAEANALSQFSYYATSANRIKKKGDSGANIIWWGRTPGTEGYWLVINIQKTGTSYITTSDSNLGISPFGCI